MPDMNHCIPANTNYCTRALRCLCVLSCCLLSLPLLAPGPLGQSLQGNLFETLVITAYYGLVALLALLWIRPFYRDLKLLRKAAADFGAASFDPGLMAPAFRSTCRKGKQDGGYFSKAMPMLTIFW